MSKLKKKFEFYDVRHLFEKHHNSHYYMVIGERSNGKTWSSLDHVLDNYFTKGEQFAYVRRFDEDIKASKMSQAFADHVEKGLIAKKSMGMFNSIKFHSGQFTPVLIQEKSATIVGPEPCGFAMSLNSMEHYKSISYPKVTTVIFDEFLSRKGYLPNEFILFTNLLSTIIRQRNNVRIIMLGNTVNKYCPYFAEMGLKHIKDQRQGTVDVYHYSTTELEVVVEYCSSSSNKGGKDSDVYFAFDNPQLQMITGGSWEIAIYPHLEIKYRPKDVVTSAFIEFDGQLLHLELVQTDSTYFLFVHPKTTQIKDEENDVVYSDVPSQRWNFKFCLTRQGDKLSATIIRMIRENRVFFSDNETGEIFRNYLIWSDSYTLKG